MLLLKISFTVLIIFESFSFGSKDKKCPAELLRKVANHPLAISQNDSVLKLLPPIVTLPLPKDLITRIKKHSLFIYSKRMNQGNGIAFSLSYYPEIDPSMLGESIQSQFIANILKELFPKAHIIGKSKKVPKGIKVIKLLIDDTFEQYEEVEKTNVKNLIPMADIKPANGTMISLDKNLIRDHFGIPDNLKVTSVYMRDVSYSRDEAMEVVRRVQTDLNADIVFLSFNTLKRSGTGDGKDWTNHFVRASKEFAQGMYDFGFLSEYSPSDLTLYRKSILLINDEVGYLPYLHSASDLAVIGGPINIFEPLMVGTPTIILRTDANSIGFVDEGFDKMIETAYKTNLAKVISLPSELKPASDELMKKKRSQFIPPYLVENENHISPIDHLLNVLNGIIQKELKTKKASK